MWHAYNIVQDLGKDVEDSGFNKPIINIGYAADLVANIGFKAAASALNITEDELNEKLSEANTIADIPDYVEIEEDG